MGQNPNKVKLSQHDCLIRGKSQTFLETITRRSLVKCSAYPDSPLLSLTPGTSSLPAAGSPRFGLHPLPWPPDACVRTRSPLCTGKPGRRRPPGLLFPSLPRRDTSPDVFGDIRTSEGGSEGRASRLLSEPLALWPRNRGPEKPANRPWPHSSMEAPPDNDQDGKPFSLTATG